MVDYQYVLVMSNLPLTLQTYR